MNSARNGLTEDEERALRLGKARLEVDAFIDMAASDWNVKRDEIPELIEAVRWIIQHRKFIARIANASVIVTVTVLVGWVIVTFAEGILHSIGIHK
jgi:hypothetical protein